VGNIRPLEKLLRDAADAEGVEGLLTVARALDNKYEHLRGLQARLRATGLESMVLQRAVELIDFITTSH
jgi:hypothetical protein